MLFKKYINIKCSALIRLMMHKMKQYTAIDLFSGAGGLHIGFDDGKVNLIGISKI